MTPLKTIIVAGNPVNGLSFIGPFEDREAAEHYADGLVDTDWWIADLDPPEGT